MASAIFNYQLFTGFLKTGLAGGSAYSLPEDFRKSKLAGSKPFENISPKLFFFFSYAVNLFFKHF